MKTAFLFTALLLTFTGLKAQDADFYIARSEVQEKIDLQNALEKEKQGPFWFGVSKETSINFSDFKLENTAQDAPNVYQIRVETEDSKTLNYQFQSTELPIESQILIKDYKENLLVRISGSELQKSTFYNTFPLLGNKHILELILPTNYTQQPSLELSKVTYGYKAGDAFCESAGACNIDASTATDPTALNIRNSIGVILVANSGYCSGTLVDNPKENQAPYFLTANHCVDSDGDVSNWSVGFKYYDCSGSTANIPTIINGANLLARNTKSDFALIELDNAPTLSDNVFYSGWDRSDITPTGNTRGFHHPNGAPMKVSVNNNTLVKTTYYEEPDSEKSWRLNWESGTTEGGSSGSGLFTENGDCIGHLIGGDAACGNSSNDYYGRLSVGFEIDSEDKSLQPWLNPGYNTNTRISGYNPNTAKTGYDVFVSLIDDVSPVSCDGNFNPTVKVYNNGIQNSLAGNVDILINNSIVETIALPSIAPNTEINLPVSQQTLVAGENTLELIVKVNGDANTMNDTSRIEISSRPEAIAHNFSITVDDWGSEITWEIIDASNNVVYSGGPYADFTPGKVYDIPMCLNIGCYQLKFSDSYGDGISDGFDGSYTLTNQNNVVVASGWNLPPKTEVAQTETSDFCATPDGIKENIVSNFTKIYPNPSNGLFYLSNSETITELAIYSYDGRLIDVIQESFNEINTTIPNGAYKLVVTNKTGGQNVLSLIIAQ